MITLNVNNAGDVTVVSLNGTYASNIYHIEPENFHAFAIENFDSENASQSELDRICKLWDDRLLFKYISFPNFASQMAID
jgi:hypothetical protein